jgi:hypothetical protein
MRRFIGLAVVMFTAVVAVAMFATPAAAQVSICSNTGFATSAGTNACDGAGAPVTASATVRTSARLTLEQVFGANASSLDAPFGMIDAFCLSTPGSGITCAEDAANSRATWYGSLQFKVRLSGLGTSTARLTGVRPSLGSIPAGQLLDGGAGSEPTTAYTESPTSISLQGALGNGTTTVTRSVGLRVLSTDAAGGWSGNAQYSVVIE